MARIQTGPLQVDNEMPGLFIQAANAIGMARHLEQGRGIKQHVKLLRSVLLAETYQKVRSCAPPGAHRCTVCGGHGYLGERSLRRSECSPGLVLDLIYDPEYGDKRDIPDSLVYDLLDWLAVRGLFGACQRVENNEEGEVTRR